MNSNELNGKKILAVLAHPDDEAFGMGGSLAFYASKGVHVHLICATLGEAGMMPEAYRSEGLSAAEVRQAELDCSVSALGIAELHKLGYRDSGMQGSPDNQHPQALVAQPMQDVVEKIAAIMREVQPEVVLTFDPVGGYHHPDHIRIHEATVKAFELVRATKTSEQAFQRLYFHSMPKNAMKFMVGLMRLQGKDPHKGGKNGDIDYVRIASETFPTHVKVNYAAFLEQKKQAGGCHASQGGGLKGRGFTGFVMRLLVPSVDYYMQGWPEPEIGQKPKKDLFEGIL